MTGKYFSSCLINNSITKEYEVVCETSESDITCDAGQHDGIEEIVVRLRIEQFD